MLGRDIGVSVVWEFIFLEPPNEKARGRQTWRSLAAMKQQLWGGPEFKTMDPKVQVQAVFLLQNSSQKSSKGLVIYDNWIHT